MIGLVTGGAYADEVGLRAGDIISLRLVGVPDTDRVSVSGNYTVAGEGTVRLPYLEEEIVAAGLPPSKLARSIEKLYVAKRIYTRPTVLITLDSEGTSRFVTVAGEIRSPGDVAYRADLTLLAALSARGGFTDYANVRNVRLIRGAKVSKHDLKQVIATPESDILLKPGDRIVVAQAGLFRRR